MQLLQPNPAASSLERKIDGGASMLVGLQLKGKHVLVIGGGKEAANRTFFALDAGALLTVVSPLNERHPAVIQRIQMGLCQSIDRNFDDDDLDTEYTGLGTRSTTWPVDVVLSCI